MHASRLRGIFVGCGVVALAAPAAMAQAAADSGARVGSAFLQAVAAERYGDAVRLLDLWGIEAHRRRTLANWDLNPRDRKPVTADDLMRSSPDMPRAVAEYQAKKYSEPDPDADPALDYEFANVSDAKELAALPLADVAERWLQAQWGMVRFRRRLERLGCPNARQFTFPDSVVGPRVIASTTVGDTITYLLFEFAWERIDAHNSVWHSEAPHILRVRRLQSGWRVIPTSRLLRHLYTGGTPIRCPDGTPTVRRPPRE